MISRPLEDDGLGLIRGCINGAGPALVLWALIFLVFLWVMTP